MNLAKYLHLRWADVPELNELLPVEKVFTGMSSDPAPPYAAISKESERPFTRHNDGSAIDKVVMRIQVFHDEYDAGAAVLHEIKSAFERAAFDLDDGDKVLDMLRIDDTEKQLDAGTWQFSVDFQCLVYLPEGV
jgi:hypothetical protein